MKKVAFVVAFAVALGAGFGGLRAQTPEPEGIRRLLDQLQQAAETSTPETFLALLAPSADVARATGFFSTEFAPGATRVVIQERAREPEPGPRAAATGGYRLIVEALFEFGQRGRIATWQLDVTRMPDADDVWRIADAEALTSVENLYRLGLDPSRQFVAHDLTISAEDLEVTLPAGSVFVADTDLGVTALVLLGRGSLRFHPTPKTEQGQVKIFCGSETLDTSFDAAFLRISPGDFDHVVAADHVTATAVDPRALADAQAVFAEESTKSFGLDLGDLSRESWSLLPAPGDFLAELRTPRFGTLTYAHAASEAEDVTLFDRKHHRNIALYSSKAHLRDRGRFYADDDRADYEVTDYRIDLSITPSRGWLEGRAELRLRIRSLAVQTLTLALADPLVVQSIVSDTYGRLFGVRVRDQNAIVVSLPEPVTRGTELRLAIAYAGRLEPQTPDREAFGQQQRQPRFPDFGFDLLPKAEPSYLYSSRSHWYPQPPAGGYATATLRLTVPVGLECVASGELLPGSPSLLPATADLPERKVYVFSAPQPVRYLAFVVSRFVRVETLTMAVPHRVDPDDEGSGIGFSYNSLRIAVEANPRQADRTHGMVEHAAAMAQYYASILGDTPYPTFTVAIVEGSLPSGHSPAYFAELTQPLQRPSAPLTWHNDPAAFINYPDFFLAHELAHQWWGQAVGWRNYHEQWLSEAFAQYFAALYAQHERGDDVFRGIMRQLRRFAMDDSDQGPVYLGYRVGHIRGESRVFRAIVYNKGAAVLQMLRRLIGDDAFFSGLRRFYWASRFQKVGTDNLQKAMEEASGRPLGRFFDGWIYGTALPRLSIVWHDEQSARGHEAVFRITQHGEIFDVPLTATLRLTDGTSRDVVLPVTDRQVELRIKVASALRDVDIRNDDGTLAEIEDVKRY